jgi:hypothetical protein
MRVGSTMELDAANLDAPVSPEQAADYWRERAECLEEWVCELLGKNQTLRMDLEKERSLRRQREETNLAFSLLGRYQSPFSSARLAFGMVLPRFGVDAGPTSCQRKECTEIRESLIQYAAMNEFVPETRN